METTHPLKPKLEKSQRLFFETVLIMAITVLLSILFQEWKGIITLIPAIYFLIERRVRKRSWSDVGFKFKNTFIDIKNNWGLVILVALGTQILTMIIAYYWVPGYVQHVLSRIPIGTGVLLVSINFLMAATFMEELIFRAFFQERLSWYINAPLAIGIASVVFALLHFSKGSYAIVSFDLVTIFIDSFIYGIIYHRTKNIFASWIPHLLADFVGLTLLISLFH